jgi:very-short-patch-repair endonuclease
LTSSFRGAAGAALPGCAESSLRGAVDLLWEKQRLAIETDGEETHGTAAAFQRDRWRDQLLVAAGYRTARLTWNQVHNEPKAVVNRIARMLKST